MHENVESLRQELRRIVAADRENLVLFLRRLDAFDRERGWARIGFDSLWLYLVEELHFPEASAWRRSNALQLLRRFPRLEAPLSDGRLNLTTLEIVGRVMTEENADDLVRRATHLTKRQAEELVVSIQPREVPDTGLRKLPAPQPRPALVLTASSAATDAPIGTSAAEVTATVAAHAAEAPLELRPPAPRPRIEPVAEERWSLRITLDRRRKEKLDELRRLLSHKVRDGNLEALFDHMLEDSLEKQRRRRGLAKPTRKVKAPLARAPTPGKRAPIPAAVRRAVLERDGHRCTYVSPDGRRCEATAKVELHHEPPAPVTGSSTEKDLTTRCTVHNGLAAVDFYGREHVERRIAQAKRTRASAAED